MKQETKAPKGFGQNVDLEVKPLLLKETASFTGNLRIGGAPSLKGG